MRCVPETLIHELQKFSVPELCDGMADSMTMDAAIKPWVTSKKIVGPAFTVQVPADEGGLAADALEQVHEGEIIVIAGHGSLSSSYWGDHRSFCAQMAGAKGVVIDGAFRDIEGCEAVGFPVYARGLIPKTAGKCGAGALNVPISCGGIIVRPGDIIVADRNGVCVILPERAEKIMAAARRKIAAQEWTINEMKRTGKILPRVIFTPDHQ